MWHLAFGSKTQNLHTPSSVKVRGAPSCGGVRRCDGTSMVFTQGRRVIPRKRRREVANGERGGDMGAGRDDIQHGGHYPGGNPAHQPQGVRQWACVLVSARTNDAQMRRQRRGLQTLGPNAYTLNPILNP